MNNRNEIHVNIGEVKIGQANELLKTTLGSCVGIGFLWKEKGLYGLAHCLLPASPKLSVGIGARFVNHAIPSLMSMMGIKKVETSQIEVVLAGGGNMMFQLSTQNINQIGAQNIEAARNVLKEYGFHIIREDVGGTVGRQIFIDCTSGEVEILKLQEPQK